MIRTNRKLKFLSIFEFLCSSFLLISASFANPLSDWSDAKAYKPEPVLFLHGFNSSSATWSSAISELSQWFSKYQIIGPYLETIDFQNPIGSVDTYPDGSDGWADMLNYKINDLMASNKYGAYTNKINLICHSMGGLAAREYLTNGKFSSGYVDKLILIGTPNLGSPLTNAGKAIVSAYRIGTMWTLPLAVSLFSFRDDIDSVAKLTWIPNFNTSEALEDMTPDSDFLIALNNRFQPSGVEYYGIYGIVGNFLNRFYFGDWYGGDGIVSERSQLGTGRVSFNKSPRKIEAYHSEEPAISVSGDNPLLKFLDSTKPEFEITSPNSNGTTELSGSSVHIQGKVYKEYLPADSKLHLRVVRESDGVVVLDENRLNSIKPSDLWIPNDPDSPVAEFDELITFSTKGTYKISCYIKNPAGEVSDTKNVWVKVLYEGTNIIVHCHNPEGKEINSIIGMANPRYSARIYVDGDFRDYGASDLNTHNQPIAVGPGNHTIKATFNGMTMEENINVENDQTKIVTFTFIRTEFNLTEWIENYALSCDFSQSETNTLGYQPDVFNFDHLQTKDCKPLGLSIRTIEDVRGWHGDDPPIWANFDTTANASVYFDSTKYEANVDASCDMSLPDGDYPSSRCWVRSEVGQNNWDSRIIELPIVNFQYWYTQYYRSGKYPTLYWISNRESGYIITDSVSEDSEEYQYTRVRADFSGYGVAELSFRNCYTIAEADFYNRSSSTSNKIYGTIRSIKMSSVPYDFLGTAI